jgi:hypothetical protein
LRIRKQRVGMELWTMPAQPKAAGHHVEEAL